jgi:hypothetical protein
MPNQVYDLKEEAYMLINMVEQLKAIEIEVQKILVMLDRLSLDKLNSAKELDAKARLENLKIYEVRVKRPARKRKIKVYSYWYTSWRTESKVKNVCLGSTEKMTHDEALIKARKLKAEYLGISF